MRKAHIISIGNELLIGDTVNTNASWIGRELTGYGLHVERVFTVPDEYSIIKDQLRDSLARAEFTIVTGGLGPTHDDITKKVVADLFQCNMVKDERVLKNIQSIFERRNFRISRSNFEQAMLPDKCEVLFNKQGTAPGMWFQQQGHYLAVLPGVPYEMEYLVENEIIPRLQSVFSGREVWVTEYYKTAGVPESTLSDQIGDLDEYLDNGTEVAYLPNTRGVTIRISTSGSDREQAETKLVKLREMLYKKAGNYIYGTGKDTELAGVVGDMLASQGMTIAVAESCTGGLLASRITDQPGSSRYLLGGVVAYSNLVKAEQLGVSRDDLDRYGAVSKETALQMAKGVAQKMGSDIGVSTTGIAGPGGGSKEKPVGTVWMGFWIKGDHFALHTIFTNNRHVNKDRTVMVVLETLRRRLLNAETLPYELKPQTH